MKPQVTIELARIGKPTRTYTEGFVSDDGTKLRTLSVLRPEVSVRFSRGWQKGRIRTRSEGR